MDGTYELFRQFFGQPPRSAPGGAEVGAALGVVTSLLSMVAGGATHIGVATDHVIESFRNDLWPGYKTGAGVPRSVAGSVRRPRDSRRGTRGDAVADGGARGGRRDGLCRVHRGVGPAGGAGASVHAGQGSRSVRRGTQGRAARPQDGCGHRRGRGVDQVRGCAGLDPRLARARG